MTAGLSLILVICLLIAAWVALRVRKRHVMIWLPSYLKGNWAGRRAGARRSPIHVLFCIADHFEPGLGGASPRLASERVARWVRDYPQAVAPFRDADGGPPRHTFFFPAEQYSPELIESLTELVRQGYGEVEVHLHHDGDTATGLRRALLEFTERLRSHGHLGPARSDDRPRFAFVHGNWALDNSLPDGRWCGVNDELRVLRECGCYADFTLPSAPSPAQTRRINSIYYALDDPVRPRSHDDGIEVRLGGKMHGDLMLIQGPLTITWPGGRFGIMPRLETANLTGVRPVTPRRVAAWVNARVCVEGRPDWVFVKAYTHGCDERNRAALLGRGAAALHECLANGCNDGKRYVLHYVTAREMYNIARAAERGLEGDPALYRDYEIDAPPAAPTQALASGAQRGATP